MRISHVILCGSGYARHLSTAHITHIVYIPHTETRSRASSNIRIESEWNTAQQRWPMMVGVERQRRPKRKNLTEIVDTCGFDAMRSMVLPVFISLCFFSLLCIFYFRLSFRNKRCLYVFVTLNVFDDQIVWYRE